MNDSAGMERVLRVTQQLVDVRQRMAQLEEQRLLLQAEQAALLNALADAAIEAVSPGLRQAAPAQLDEYTPSEGILFTINREPNRIFTAKEIATILDLRDTRSWGNIRTLMSRMAKDGRLARAGYGKYRAVPRG